MPLARHDQLAAMIHRRRFFNTLAFRYMAGDSLAGLGATFSRASTATYLDANGVLQTAASGVARDGHFIAGARSLLLEGQRTNSFLNSGTPASHTSPSLATGTYTLWLVGTGTIAVAAGTATLTGAGTATSAAKVTFTVTVAGTVTFTVAGGPTRAQCENGPFASSYIATAGSAVTRSADILSFPWSQRPQPLTLHIKGVELGTVQVAGGGIFRIDDTGNNPMMESSAPAGKYRVLYNDGTAIPIATAAVAPAFGDTIELRPVLNQDGSVAIGQAINGAAEVVATVGTTATLPAAWPTPTSLWVGNRSGAAPGFFAFQSFKVALGVQSLATMRGL